MSQPMHDSHETTNSENHNKIMAVIMNSNWKFIDFKEYKDIKQQVQTSLSNPAQILARVLTEK